MVLPRYPFALSGPATPPLTRPCWLASARRLKSVLRILSGLGGSIAAAQPAARKTTTCSPLAVLARRMPRAPPEGRQCKPAKADQSSPACARRALSLSIATSSLDVSNPSPSSPAVGLSAGRARLRPCRPCPDPRGCATIPSEIAKGHPIAFEPPAGAGPRPRPFFPAAFGPGFFFFFFILWPVTPARASFVHGRPGA